MDLYEQYQEVANIRVEKDFKNYHKIVSWNEIKHKHRFNQVLKLTKELKSDCDSILDVGCGSGLYIKKLKDMGFKANGIDFSPNQIKNCKKFFGLTGNEVKVGDILNMKFSDNSFDIVLSMGTHLLVGNQDNIKKAIGELARVSKKYLIIDVLNDKFFFNPDKYKSN